MRSNRAAWASRLRIALPACLALLALALAAQPAFAVNTKEIDGNPLTIWVGDNGSFQDLVAGNTDYSFYPRADKNGNAGFALAFPTSGQSGLYSVPSVAGKVWGWTSDASPSPTFGGEFTAVSQGNVTGIGTEGSPYQQQTTYQLVAGVALLDITQTTTYINGSSTFQVSYHVHNRIATPVKFRALVAADLYLNGSDCGVGVFKSVAPRFVGGTSLGRVGGFTEDSSSSPWSQYFEGQFSNSFNSGCQLAGDQWPDTVWDHLQGAADGAGFPSTVNTSSVLDNGIGVQWDTYYTSALGANSDADFQFNTLGTVPGLLTLTPSSQSVAAGGQAALNAIVTDGSGAPAAGATVKFTISGANSGSADVTTDSSGQAAFFYKPSKAGTDTVTAFQDIDLNGAQGQAEPNGTATVTVSGSGTSSDKTAPHLRIIVRRSLKLKALLKGLVTAADSSEPASLRFELMAPSKPRAKTFTKRVARVALPFGKGGTRAVVLRPKPKKLPKSKKFKLRVRVTATDKAGNRTVATKLIKIK
jgi:hypothetical protein